MKVLVGGVAAGTKVAAKLMREDRSNEVIVLNKGRISLMQVVDFLTMWDM